MRFASRIQKYRHGIRPGREMVLADGQRQVLQTELAAQFSQAEFPLTEDEIAFATENMNHRGLPIDRDTETQFSPRSRISGFDSEHAQSINGWTDEDREVVEQGLLTSPNRGDEFILLPEVRVAAPWATYDSTPAREVAKFAKSLNIPFEDVLAYERQNRNDAAVILLLEDAAGHDDAAKEADAEVVIEA